MSEDVLRKKINDTITKANDFPLLDIIALNLQRALAARLRQTFARPVEAILDDKGIQRFGSYFDTLMFPAILCMFESDRLPGRGLVFIEGKFMEDIIEMMLGFPENREGLKEARTPTSIDKALIFRLVDQCLEELSNCFHNAHDEIGEIEFTATTIETSPQFAMITNELTPCYIARFFFDIGESGYGGGMDFVMPIPMLQSIRRYLEQSFRGDRRGDDKSWQKTLTFAISRLPFPMRAELDKIVLPFSQLQRWKIGDVIPLDVDSPPQINLVYENGRERELLAVGDLGIKRSRKAVRLKEQTIDNFLGGLSNILIETDIMVPKKTKLM